MDYYNEINRKVKKYSINKSDLETYYNARKMLSEAGKHYGEGIIKEYSQKLKFYNYVVDKKMPTVSTKIIVKSLCRDFKI